MACVVHVMVIAAGLVAGCAEALADECGKQAQPPVVRVCTPSGLQAGTPFTRWSVLSTRPSGGDCSIAVVDGTPAEAELMTFSRGPGPAEFSILFSACAIPLQERFHTFDGACGAEALVAGFHFADNPSPIEVLRTPAEVVCASVEDELGEDVILRVPAGCYAGFVGGPAGEYRAGSFSVWGIITEQLEEPKSGEYSCLCIRKLPAVDRPEPPAATRSVAIPWLVDLLWLWTYGVPVNSSSVSVPASSVLHIDGGLGLGSGFAVTEDLLVTAAHVATGSEVLAVDGLPARVIARGSGAPGHAGDWAIARASGHLTVPLPLDGREELPAGQRVILGGLPGPVDWSVAGAFLEKEPVFVEGVVRKCEAEPGGPVVRIDVSIGDYHGASGGPVITVADDGQMRLWGFLTGTAWPIWPVDLVLGYTGLLVTPIPRALQSYAPEAFSSSRNPPLHDP